MEILSRSEARQQDKSQYFTGQPCKNGHVAYRYTQSGTCSQCIRAAAGPAIAADHAEAKTKLVQVQFRVYDVDRDTFAAAAYGFALMRFPMLRQGDVDPRLLVTDVIAGAGFVRMNCHVDDVGPLRELADTMFRKRTSARFTLTFEAKRQQAYEEGQKHVHDDTIPENFGRK